jgi:RimJ/RimL family protein N-acetyltransferase
MLGPTLETARLFLRPPSAADFPAFAEFVADANSTRYLGGPQMRTAAWRSFAMLIGAWTLNGFSMFSFIEKETGRWVGRGGPWQPEGWPGTEVGWGIIPTAQRRGYAKEAATRVFDWAFDELGWTEVLHCIDPANQSSIQTALSLGSRLRSRAVRAPAPLDATWDIYGQTRAEWHARQR